MFKRKADARELGDGVSELMYKLIQNSLYGKAGQKEIIHSFRLIDNNKVKEFELKNKTDLSHVFSKKTLIRTQGRIEAELEGITTKPSHQESLYDEEDGTEEGKSRDAHKRIVPRKKFGVKSSVSIAAAITAYARINMSQYKNIEDNKYLGGDTDSAIMEKELPQDLVGKGLGMMKEECRVSLGLFADKKLYLMRDGQGVTVIKSRGVGREAGGKDILTYGDFIKLFRGEVLKIMKTKFIIKKDGIYIMPQALTVRISNIRLAKIREELKVILANIFHPLYALAVEIGATGSTALAPRSLKALALTIVTYGFVLVYHHIVLFKEKICDAIIPFILYVGRNGVSLDLPYFRSSLDAAITPFTFYVDPSSGANLYAHEFNSKVYRGLMLRIFYTTAFGNLDSSQFYSKINKGLIPYILYIDKAGLALDHVLFYSKINEGIIEYVIYIDKVGLALDYNQFYSKINRGITLYIIYILANGVGLNYQQFHEIYRGYMLQPKSDPEVAKEVIVVKYNGMTTAAGLIREVKQSKKLIAATKKVIASIKEGLGEIEHTRKKIKRNEKDRERRRLLKEKNPELYEERQRIRNDKARASAKIKSIKLGGSKRQYHTSSNFFSSSAIYRLLILDDSLNEGISTAAPSPEVVVQDHVAITEKYKALIPFKRSYENILSPIFLTKSLLYSLDRADKCLSKLPLDSLVKRFILNRLEDKFKITAKLDIDGANILNTVRLKNPYIKKKIIESVLDDKFEAYHTEVSYNPINFASYNSSIFRLEQIYGSLQAKFDKGDLVTFNTEYQLKSGDNSGCGCYIIYSKNSLYYYIGYSKDIKSRLKTHYNNLKSLNSSCSVPYGTAIDLKGEGEFTRGKILKELVDSVVSDEVYNASESGKKDLFKFYINSCYKNKVDFDIKMGPICLYSNYFSSFLQKYPDYKLNAGEYLILTFYTDLVGKILEQSLIRHYNPLLNSLKYVGVKNIT